MEAKSVRQDLVTGDLVIEANCDATYCGNPIRVTVAHEDIPGYFEMLNAMEAKDREIEGLMEFLKQVVTVPPKGKDLWIQTVKIRAAQYLDAKEES